MCSLRSCLEEREEFHHLTHDCPALWWEQMTVNSQDLKHSVATDWTPQQILLSAYQRCIYQATLCSWCRSSFNDDSRFLQFLRLSILDNLDNRQHSAAVVTRALRILSSQSKAILSSKTQLLHHQSIEPNTQKTEISHDVEPEAKPLYKNRINDFFYLFLKWIYYARKFTTVVIGLPFVGSPAAHYNVSFHASPCQAKSRCFVMWGVISYVIYFLCYDHCERKI